MNSQEERKAKACIRSARWRERNRDKAVAATNRWNRENPDRVLANMKKYKTAKLQRCPKWLSEEDHAEIREVYNNAKLCRECSDIMWEVDHITPLQGENVSGLHVPWNLRVVTRQYNRVKHNR